MKTGDRIFVAVSLWLLSILMYNMARCGAEIVILIAKFEGEIKVRSNSHYRDHYNIYNNTVSPKQSKEEEKVNNNGSI